MKRQILFTAAAGVAILLALAATSTNGIRRRMGTRWQKLHYGVYVAGILGVWHYWWQVKLDTSDPAIYAVLLAILLGYRLWHRKRKVAAQRKRNGYGDRRLETT